jgi:signal transduction histidine kinase
MASATLSSRPTESGSGLMQRLRNMPVFLKLYLTIMAVVLLTLLVTALLVSGATAGQQLKVQTDNLRDLSLTFADSLDNVLAQDVVGRIEVLSLNLTVQDAVVVQNAGGQSLDDILAKDQAWVTAADTDPLIAGILDNRLAGELREFRSVVSNHVETFVTDASGALVASTNRTSDYYQADEGWWQSAWNDGNGAIFIGQPEFDESSGSLSLIVALPIYAHSEDATTSDTQIIGVLRSTYLFDSLVSLFPSAGADQRAVLDLYLGEDIRLSQDVGPDQDQFTTLDETAQTALAALPNRSAIQTAYDGDDSLVFRLNIADISTFPFVDALGWFVVAHVTQADTFALIAQSNLAVGASALLGLGLAALLGAAVARAIVQPIRQLTDSAKRFSGGDLKVRVASNSRDEVGTLAQSFNQMADEVENRENMLGEINQSLEQRVQERTLELRKANALANESVRLKSEFLSTMSHELRTPLNAMLGYTSLMVEGLAGDFDPDSMDMISRVHKNSQRLLLLINEVLDLARVEAGRMEVVIAPFSVHELAGQWQSQMEVLAQEKNLDFTVTLDETLPAVLYSDKDRITQVVVNLLSNAFKFTEKGSVALNIAVADANTWTLSVTDSGIGIPPHALNYIFDEFRQVDGSSKRVYGGSGLGLAIVRNLCRVLNGKVSVTSEIGQGSTFTVSLPLQVHNPEEIVAELSVES